MRLKYLLAIESADESKRSAGRVAISRARGPDRLAPAASELFVAFTRPEIRRRALAQLCAARPRANKPPIGSLPIIIVSFHHIDMMRISRRGLNIVANNRPRQVVISPL